MKGGNNQFMITLPKAWVEVNNLGKGNSVQIDTFNEPFIDILESAKRTGVLVVLKGMGIESKREKVKRFVEDGVLLESGFWMKISHIDSISKSAKEVNLNGKENARVE